VKAAVQSLQLQTRTCKLFSCHLCSRHFCAWICMHTREQQDTTCQPDAQQLMKPAGCVLTFFADCGLLQTLATLTSYLPTLTVGLVATLTSVACIIAADTGGLRKHTQCTISDVFGAAACPARTSWLKHELRTP
jgi:hypothetical protein